jgi:hypothetical protein
MKKISILKKIRMMKSNYRLDLLLKKVGEIC